MDIPLIVVDYLQESSHSLEEIQNKFDMLTIAINNLEAEFDEHDSKIETVARESIGETIEYILDYFQIDIDSETAIREREW